MIAVSDRFLAALSRDHTEVTTVELWNYGEFIKNLELDEDSPGSITLNAGGEVLRQVSLNLAEPTDLPGKTPDHLWPTGPEIKIFSGFLYPDGTEELLPQGVFTLHNPVTENTESSLQTQIFGFDRSLSIKENRFTRPFPLSQMNIATAIQTVILDRVPNINFNMLFTSTQYQIPPVLLQHGGESNPWKDCLDMAESAGMELFFDANGDLVLRPLPDLDEPVFYYLDDSEDGIILETRREIDRSTAWSGVTLSSEHPDTDPAFVEVWDTEQNSTTNVATFGYKSYFVDTQFIAAGELTRPTDVALKKLSQVRGVSENMTFKAIANFAHEQNDVVVVRDQDANIDGIYQMKAYTRDLSPGSSLDVVNNKKRVTSID